MRLCALGSRRGANFELQRWPAQGGGARQRCSHILFSINPDLLGPILAAATAADIGLVNNDGHVEVFAGRLLDLNTFADRLVTELESGRGRD